MLLDVLTELTLDAKRKGESSFSFIEQLKNKKNIGENVRAPT